MQSRLMTINVFQHYMVVIFNKQEQQIQIISKTLHCFKVKCIIITQTNIMEFQNYDLQIYQKTVNNNNSLALHPSLHLLQLMYKPSDLVLYALRNISRFFCPNSILFVSLFKYPMFLIFLFWVFRSILVYIVVTTIFFNVTESRTEYLLRDRIIAISN